MYAWTTTRLPSAAAWRLIARETTVRSERITAPEVANATAGLVSAQPETGTERSGERRQTGEFGLIARVAARLGPGSACLLGPGDDAAMVAAPDGRVVASTDVLVEGRHFRRDWSRARGHGPSRGRGEPGRHRRDGSDADRAAGRALRAARPGGGWAEELADGLAAEAGLVGASVVGGDMSASPTLTIAVTALGDLQGGAPVLRSGARPGDVVALAGRVGLRRGRVHRAVPRFPHPEAAGGGVPPARRCRTRPGPPAARLGATSMIDVSDGLLADLGHIADGQRGRHRRRTGTRSTMPRADARRGRRRSASTRTAGCSPAGTTTRWPRRSPRTATLPEGWRVIGRVHEGAGVTVDGEPFQGRAGGSTSDEAAGAPREDAAGRTVYLLWVSAIEIRELDYDVRGRPADAGQSAGRPRRPVRRQRRRTAHRGKRVRAAGRRVPGRVPGRPTGGVRRLAKFSATTAKTGRVQAACTPRPTARDREWRVRVLAAVENSARQYGRRRLILETR